MKYNKEIEIVQLMIEIYCNKKHHTSKGKLCSDCQQLLEYAQFRRSKCPWGDDKPFCSNCPVHCYKAEMRNKIKQVMRFSGPRMIFHHPIVAIRHITESKKQRRKLRRSHDRQATVCSDREK